MADLSRAPWLLAAAASAALAGCAEETIAHQQIEREANRMLVILRKSGIEAIKVRDEEARELRFDVRVPREQAGASFSLLEEHNLPETVHPDTAKMFESGSMIPTSEQERAKREVGVSGDIMNALRKIPRVVDVRAVVSIPENDPLRDVNEARPRPKASVMVLYRPDGASAPPLTTEDVQKFVNSRLTEIKPTEVNVLLLPTGGAMNGGGEAAPPPIDPDRGCVDKETVIGIEVCAGNKRKVVNLVMIAGIVAGLLAAMAVVAVLRAMRYRKDLTRLTAQFERVRK